MTSAETLEEYRLKSKNLQGGVSGSMKKCIYKIKDAVRTLVGKAEAIGDPAYLRSRAMTLSKQLEDLKKDNLKIRQDLEASNRRILDLEKLVRDKNVGNVPVVSPDLPMSIDSENASEDTRDITRRVLLEHGLSPLTVMEGPVRRLSIKGTKAVIPAPPVEEVNVLSDRSRREVELSAQIDALILKRKEVREDIVRSVDEPLSGTSAPPPAGRRGPRIVSDTQVVPPRSEASCEGPGVPVPALGDGSWAQAVKSGRRSRGGTRRSELSRLPLPSVHAPLPTISRFDADHRGGGNVSDGLAVKSAVSMSRSSAKKRKTRRAPKTAVVSIRRDPAGPSYAYLLRKAREGVALNELDISGTRIRWSANGAALIEISGQDKSQKAELLAAKISEVLTDEAVVTRPVAIGELYIRGFDESIDVWDITNAIGNIGGCSFNSITIGTINRIANGLCSVWSRCPLTAAIKIAEHGNLRMGWSLARVMLQQARPIQCFRCWGYGHVSGKCESEIDRSDACFRCGKRGHPASGCSAAPFCAVCSRTGLSDDHRMGSKSCQSAESARNKQVNRVNKPDSVRQFSPMLLPGGNV